MMTANNSGEAELKFSFLARLFSNHKQMAFAHGLLRKGNKAAEEGNDRANEEFSDNPMASAIPWKK